MASSHVMYSDTYRNGIRLFNEGSFWHAHEQWEACWLAADGLDALFYKGIIQAAATLVKWQQGNVRGMQLNWAKSNAKLNRFPGVYMGLDVPAFCSAMAYFVAAQCSGRVSPVPQFSLVERSSADVF